MVLAIGAVAIGVILLSTGIVGQIQTIISPAASDEATLQDHYHGIPSLLTAEAAPMPLILASYATNDYVRDGDAAVGPPVADINEEFHGRSCEFCIRIEYNPYTVGKAGFALPTARPLDVENPQRLLLGARGEYGGEQVRFLLLGKQISATTSTLDGNLFDNVEFLSKSETVTLTTNYRPYQVEVPAADPEKFNDITHLLAIEVDKGNGIRPVIIYLEGLVYDANEPDPRFIVEEAKEDLVG